MLLISSFKTRLSLKGEMEIGVAAETFNLMKMKRDKGGAYEMWGSDQSKSNSAAGAGESSPEVWMEASPVAVDHSRSSYWWSWCKAAQRHWRTVRLAWYQDLKEVGTRRRRSPCFWSSPWSNQGSFQLQLLHVTANIFTPTVGGYVGVMDTETKEAIALFLVTASQGDRWLGNHCW